MAYFNFAISFQLDSLIGYTLTMTVARVSDVAGNFITSAYTWSFMMQDFGIKTASVQVSGLKLNVPFNINFTMASSPFVANFSGAVSAILNLPIGRIQNVIASQAPDGNTSLRFIVVPSSGGDRRDIEAPTSTEAVALLQAISRNPSSVNVALLRLMMPSSVSFST